MIIDKVFFLVSFRFPSWSNYRDLGLRETRPLACWVWKGGMLRSRDLPLPAPSWSRLASNSTNIYFEDVGPGEL